MLTFSVNKKNMDLVHSMSTKSFVPKTDLGREWLSTFWINGVEGNLQKKYNEKDVDITSVDAYGYGCNTKAELNKVSKEEALLSVDEVNEGLKGISEAVASYVDENIDTIAEMSEIDTIVSEFVEAREYLLVEEGVDIWRVMKLALESNIKAIARLKGLIEEYSMSDLIYGALNNEHCIGKLKGVLA